MVIELYKTVKSNVRVELIEKKSRFIASIFRVTSVEQITQILENIRKEFYDATHNVYAWTVGLDYPMQKYSDDGEPQGTAGLPVMEVIKRNSLYNTLIVVTRYFGGILLGAGGLIRAYSAAAVLGIEKSGIAEYSKCTIIKLTTEYQFLEPVKSILKNFNTYIKNIEYSDVVEMTIKLPEEYVPKVKIALIDTTSNNILIEEKESIFDIIGG